MMKIEQRARTLRSWEEDLMPSEVEALHEELADAAAQPGGNAADGVPDP